MRITIVQGPFLPVPPLLGGAVEKVWFALGKEFVKNGHHVTHLSRSYSDLPLKELIDGVNHQRLSGFDATSFLFLNILLDFIYAFHIYRNLPEADILVSNSFSLPLFVRNKNYGLLYIHIARKPKGQLFLYKHARRLQTVSRTMEKEIIKEVPQYKQKIVTIPYPLTFNTSDKNIADMLSDKENLMLYVGRIHPEKGLDILINAFNIFAEKHSGWKLNIVGPWEINEGGGGDRYYHYLRKISEQKSGNIKFIGPVFDENKLCEFYKRARLFVYPSIAEKGESFGLAPLEAMSFGCVPIVSSLECFKEFIDDNISGYLFDYRSADSTKMLADILSMTTGKDSNLSKISENSYRKSKQYTLGNISRLYLEDFSRMIN